MGWVYISVLLERTSTLRDSLSRLAAFSRLILFDKREPDSRIVSLRELPTLEQRMDDVRAVMDAVGSTQAALIGVSEGGPRR